MRIPLCTRRVEDFWAWSREKRGNFTVRSAYRMIQNTKLNRENWLYGAEGTSGNDEGSSWSSLWKTEVPNKIRVFLWRLARESIPRHDILHHRHMATSPACQLCGAADSWRHALLECALSRSVWSLASEHLVEQMSTCADACAKTWLFTLNSTLSHADFTRLWVTLWAIWSSRRKLIHEGIHQTPYATNGFIAAFISDLQVVAKPQGHPRVVQPSPARWIPPQEGNCKINVDAALMRTRPVGAVAAVCWDRHGIFVGVSTITFHGIDDPATLEALAIRESLALADDLYERRISVASDCKVVVDDIRQRSAASYGAIIREVVDRSKSFISCLFSHEFRSLNVEAHNLAKHALSLGVGRRVWLGNPGDLSFVPVNIVTT